MKELKDYILILNNIMPPPVINEILEEYKESDDWIDASIGSGENKDVRNCKTIGMSFNGIIEKNKEKRQKIDKIMFVIASQALKEYARKYNFTYGLKEDSGYDLLKYNEGGFYKQHTDSAINRPRTISCSFILNDDFEGGEFAFFDRNLIYTLKKNSCIMFPSNFMYPHEIMPVTKGTRYSIITWFI